MTTIGYTRVSTAAQNAVGQVAALRKAGATRIVRDVCSGASDPFRRAGLGLLLRQLQHGDELLVWKGDRLARSVLALLNLMAELERRGVVLRSLTEPIETATPAGRLAVQMLGCLAEYERGLTLERVQQGIAAARARGVHCGRRAVLEPGQVALCRQLASGGESTRHIADLLGVSRTTVYAAVHGLSPYHAIPG